MKALRGPRTPPVSRDFKTGQWPSRQGVRGLHENRAKPLGEPAQGRERIESIRLDDPGWNLSLASDAVGALRKWELQGPARWSFLRHSVHGEPLGLGKRLSFGLALESWAQEVNKGERRETRRSIWCWDPRWNYVRAPKVAELLQREGLPGLAIPAPSPRTAPRLAVLGLLGPASPWLSG